MDMVRNHRRMSVWTCLHVATVSGLAWASQGAAVANPASGQAPALLTRFCGECHADGADEGGVALDALLAGRPRSGGLANDAARQQWVAVWRNLRAEVMPPADASQPSADERQVMLRYVLHDVLGVDPARPDPGHVVLRRLNRVEYANTVRDLTGIKDDVRGELPGDDTGHGFDTIGAVLSVSPMLIEKYLVVATRIGNRVAREAVLIHTPDQKHEYPSHLRRLFPYGPPPPAEASRHEHLRRTLRKLAARGFRRPPDDATLERLMEIATTARDAPGGSFEKGIAAALTAILASPQFLFRIEDDVATTAPGSGSAVLIDEFSLASRLSYFLWSTMPDDELFKLAERGHLRKELSHQVDRMLDERRSDAFVQNFVGQWLRTRDVEGVPIDIIKVLNAKRWEDADRVFNNRVRRAMRQETELWFAHVLREGRPATDLLTTKQTYVNEPLARFYGISDVTGDAMRLVDIPDDVPRGGLLTHGSFLMVTSNPTRTSPVKRGVFILDQLLGTPPPPAPPDVPPLEAAMPQSKDVTMRELMVAHRRDPLCASCHARMDPLGLALERYNALGQWRPDEAAASIDTSGRLMTGERFADARELSAVLAGPRRRDFYRCLAEKLLTYALGRGLEYFDGPTVDAIMEKVDRDDRLITFVTAIVESVPFQMRRASPVETPTSPEEARP
jgi:mono/diheme cytochrome c family protein